MLRWYRLYLRQFCMANVTDAVPRVESRKVRSELPNLTLRELVTGALARRDAAANLVSSLATVTIKQILLEVIDGKPYTFKVRPQHRDAIVAKLRGAGALVE